MTAGEAVRAQDLSECRSAAASVLAHLEPSGYQLLTDRRLPGTKRGRVDSVLTGPGGAFVVETKDWRDVSMRHGRVFRGDEDVTDDLKRLAELGEAWDKELADLGIAPGEVHVIIALTAHRGVNALVRGVRILGVADLAGFIGGRGRRLPDAAVAAIGRRAAEFMPALDPADVPLASASHDPSTDLPSGDEIQDAVSRSLIDASVEDWMVYLDPRQANLVRRSFNGPARFRGPAGTGKTVLGLHRAAQLARTRPGKVLVTTYVRTLPLVLRSMLERMAPDVVDRVDFRGVHEFAAQVLADRGVQYRLDADAARAAFEEAWAAHGDGHPHLPQRLPLDYWAEEIDHVIKGRGIGSLDDYLDLARPGRKHHLHAEQRRALWKVYEAYQRALAERRVIDHADEILLAERELARHPLEPGYASVIVEEAQDLSAAMIRMLYSLVGTERDGFTLIGDGQQSIYPGGFTLAEVGISLSGRGAVMSTNYRNTREIADFAAKAAADTQYDDIEYGVQAAQIPEEIERTGAEPTLLRFSGTAMHDTHLVQHLREVFAGSDVTMGEVAVIGAKRATVTRLLQRLQREGINAVNLQEYHGMPIDAVKVGTIKRAKGLEFRHVVVADVEGALLAPLPADVVASDEVEHGAARERWERARRELFVAFTRAREGLWVGVTG